MHADIYDKFDELLESRMAEKLKEASTMRTTTGSLIKKNAITMVEAVLMTLLRKDAN